MIKAKNSLPHFRETIPRKYEKITKNMQKYSPELSLDTKLAYVFFLQRDFVDYAKGGVPGRNRTQRTNHF